MHAIDTGGHPGDTSVEARVATASAPDPQGRALQALNFTVSTLGVIKDLAPLSVVKGALAAVLGVLHLIQVESGHITFILSSWLNHYPQQTVTNYTDFAEIADQCHRIGLIIARTTDGVFEGYVSPTMQDLLSDLKAFLEGIMTTLEHKAHGSVTSKLLHVAIDRDLIVTWQRELDRRLVLFNTELNITANLDIHQLRLWFEEFRSKAVVNIERPSQGTLPAKPSMFFGRDALLADAVQLLCASKHVALIGPGGIGKTSIAKAILNDDAVAQSFSELRYFVSYDDMDASQCTYATFLAHIARAIGIASSETSMRTLVSKFLSSFRVLLVLDNAETFLDAKNDADRIAECLDNFGARSNVVLVLTTRATSLPPNVNWERLHVPVLEESPACATFQMIYRTPIEPSTLLKLLSSVDFHPLSINILAHVAVQNEWSPRELADAWDSQHALLLENGGGKIWSLGITIETSINSPSLKKHEDIVYDLLASIAFLPQGVPKAHLATIFPSHSVVTRCVDRLCSLSLTYRKNGFITMLAPVRLYILAQYGNKHTAFGPPFSRVVSHYNGLIDANPIDPTLVCDEGVNIEHVLDHGLFQSSPSTIAAALCRTTRFVLAVIDHNPRPLALLPTVLSVLPNTPIKLFASIKSQNREALVEKAYCILFITLLMYRVGQISESIQALENARNTHPHDIFPPLRHRFLRSCDIQIGDVHSTLGNYAAAQGAYEVALRRRTYLFFKRKTDHVDDARIMRKLGGVLLSRGDPTAVHLCLASAVLLERRGRSNAAWEEARRDAAFADLFAGNTESAERYFQSALTTSTLAKNQFFHLKMLLSMVEICHRRGDISESKVFQNRVVKCIQDSPEPESQPAFVALFTVASYASLDGYIVDARAQIRLLLSSLTAHSLAVHIRTVDCFYLAACIELRANDLRTATKLFSQTVEYCTAASEVHLQAQALRALGEIYLLERRVSAATARFAEATVLCEYMGIKPEKLYYSRFSCYRLSDAFQGWGLFQQGLLLDPI